MRLFKSGKIYDFMAVRWYWIGLSLFITFAATVLLLMGKAKLGTDFTGGTEVEIAFKRDLSAGDLRAAVLKAGFSAPSVIKVDDPKNPNRYLMRVEEVSTISLEKPLQIDKALRVHADATDASPSAREATEIKFSP